MSKFIRFKKYCVFKWDDFGKYLTDEEKDIASKLIGKISQGRLNDDKALKQYIIVNQSMPYAEQVWQLIQDHWEDSQEQSLEVKE